MRSGAGGCVDDGEMKTVTFQKERESANCRTRAYQAVKYRAVLEAQTKIDHPAERPIVKVVLALDRALP